MSCNSITQQLVHGSPGLPLGYSEFTAVLKRANASHELVGNRCCWPQIYSDDGDDSNDDDDMEVEDIRTKSGPSEVEDEEEEELWEEKAIESQGTDPSVMTADDSDREEDYATPPHNDKWDQDPFAHWESNN